MPEQNENETQNEDVTEPEGAEEPAAEEQQPAPEAAAEEPEATAEEAEPAEDEAEAEDAGEEAAEEAEQTGEAEEAPAAAEAAPTREERKKRKHLPRPLRRQRPKVKRGSTGERKPITRLPKPEHERGRRQERQGVVVSAGADKTIVVRVDVVKLHPVYKKVVKRSTKLHAHDERNEAKPGDVVRLVETRPLSRMKRWRLQEIVQAAK